MSLIGKEIDDFKVSAYVNGEITSISKEDTLGHWSLYFFYPADFSFVCPTELGVLADMTEDFAQRDCKIYSVSVDSAYVHDAWAQSSPTIAKITYPMLADRAGQLGRFFDVLDEKSGNTYRGAFIVDPQGIIRAYTVNDMGIGRNPEEILRTLDATQFVAEHGDQVCPAKWEPGDNTITPGMDLIGKL